MAPLLCLDLAHGELAQILSAVSCRLPRGTPGGRAPAMTGQKALTQLKTRWALQHTLPSFLRVRVLTHHDGRPMGNQRGPGGGGGT